MNSEMEPVTPSALTGAHGAVGFALYPAPIRRAGLGR